MSKRGRNDDYYLGISSEDEEEDEANDELIFDPAFMTPSRINPDDFEMDDDDDQMILNASSLHGMVKNKLKNPITAPPSAAKYEIQPFVPVRTEKHVMDSACYFDQAALVTLLFAFVTQGVPVPGLLDEETQRM